VASKSAEYLQVESIRGAIRVPLIAVIRDVPRETLHATSPVQVCMRYYLRPRAKLKYSSNLSLLLLGMTVREQSWSIGADPRGLHAKHWWRSLTIRLAKRANRQDWSTLVSGS
jgi:hypothetical protein